MEQPTPEQEEFKAFCVEQSQRLGIFREYGFMEAPARRDYRRWLERKCATRENVQRVMDAAVELDAIPTIADLNRLFDSLCASGHTVKEADPDCRDCGGTGWVLAQCGEREGVRHCRCGYPPGFEPTRSAPAATPLSDSQKTTNQIFAEELARALSGKTSRPAETKPATDADIASLLAEQNRGRQHKPGCDCLMCGSKAVAK